MNEIQTHLLRTLARAADDLRDQAMRNVRIANDVIVRLDNGNSQFCERTVDLEPMGKRVNELAQLAAAADCPLEVIALAGENNGDMLVARWVRDQA